MSRYYTFCILFCVGIQASAQIPSGQIKGPYKWISTIYPGTERNYWIYVPAQYDAAKKTCSMIVQDGLSRARGWRLSEYLDTLIQEGVVPPIIGIYIDHGRVISKDTNDYPRFNRSFEYDALGDRYARFLLNEIIPEVKKSYNISDDPNDRALAGASSGAICAFNAAWERPDAFNRVFSTIGTYVGLRGADEVSTLVRKTEPKPLRIFLEDGYHDLNIYAGDWYIANQQLLSALTWAGYEVHHAWGEGAHSSEHALKIMREGLTWLWQGYPQKVTTHVDKYKGMSLTKNQASWTPVVTGMNQVNKLATGVDGSLFLTLKNKTGIYTLDEKNELTELTPTPFLIGDIAPSADGHFILTDSKNKSIFLKKQTTLKPILNHPAVSSIVTTPQGFYFTTAGKKIGYYNTTLKKVIYSDTYTPVQAIIPNAEHSFLNVLDHKSTLGYSYKINSDGSLTHGQEYIHYHIPYGQTTATPMAAIIDTANMMYTATNMGIQITDQLGRVNMILPGPNTMDGSLITELTWSGPMLNQLYIVVEGKLYQRSLNTKGKLSFQSAKRPPRPGM